MYRMYLLFWPVFIWRMFLEKKNPQMKAGQNNKYDITKTSGLVVVWRYTAEEKNHQITWLEVKRDLVRLPIPEPAAEVMVIQLLFWLLLLWRWELLDMTEDSRPPLAPVICLADIELLLAWLWALELLVPVIITACPSCAMAVKNIRCQYFLVIYFS